MSLNDKYYDHILEGMEVTKEEEIVFKIVHDLSGRGGIGDEWGQIDEDTKEEIFEEWIAIVKYKLDVSSNG